MRLLLASLLLPLVLTSDAPPISKGLQPEDHDLLSGEGLSRRIKARARGVIQDEVGDFPAVSGKTLNDDYSDFANEPLKNGGANHQLRQVSYQPIPKKYDIPSPEPETDVTSSVSTVGRVPAGRLQQAQYVVYQQPQPRKGYYYYHYPYQRLPRQYLLRPRYGYIYPPQYQNTVYTYHHPLPYRDYYNLYRSDPTFNPYAGAAAGCGGASPCGGYGGGYSGCGGGGGGCGGGCSGGDGCGYNGEEEEEESVDDEEGGRSGEARINKKDPLEDLELEDLEKLEKASGEKSEVSRRSRRTRRVITQ